MNLIGGKWEELWGDLSVCQPSLSLSLPPSPSALLETCCFSNFHSLFFFKPQSVEHSFEALLKCWPIFETLRLIVSLLRSPTLGSHSLSSYLQSLFIKCSILVTCCLFDPPWTSNYFARSSIDIESTVHGCDFKSTLLSLLSLHSASRPASSHYLRAQARHTELRLVSH